MRRLWRLVVARRAATKAMGVWDSLEDPEDRHAVLTELRDRTAVGKHRPEDRFSYALVFIIGLLSGLVIVLTMLIIQLLGVT